MAREPYHAGIRVDLEAAHVSAPNLVDLNRALKTSGIQDLIPLYTPTSAVAIGINLRGLEALTSFASNSTTLNVFIPNANITASFTGSTRDESLILFKDFIKEGRSLKKLLKAYARYSPIDPIAGNPNSLMAQMGEADYLLGRLSPLAGCDCSFSAQPILHQFQVGLNGGRAFTDGYDTTIATLPLRYSYSPDGNWAVILDAPLTYLRNGGASSIVGSLGMGLRVPLTHDWSLIPIFRFGSGGSLDLCTSGNFASAGITSVFNYPVSDYVLTLTNYGGYITSVNFWLTGLNFNYHMQKGIFKNGLSVSTCKGFTFLNRPLNFRLGFEDTYFTGGGLFIKHYDQVQIAMFSTGINPCLDYDCLETTFSYQWGERSYKSYTFGLAYQF
jgi:hypothetical protein